ncbi:MAG: DNA recombination protein RmuC [Candidatus Ancillula sp.]|jgi:DNA recombination protein RmuC|nr:DNA recombination protein RmuC [Candidatus Ancillula sp.]
MSILNIVVVIIGVLLVTVVGFLVFMIAKLTTRVDEQKVQSSKVDEQARAKMLETMLEFQQSISGQLDKSRTNVDNLRDNLAKTVNDRFDKSQDLMQKQFTQQYNKTTEIIENVTEKLTKLENTNNQVVGISSNLKTLQNILMNPKQRGVVGEFFLYNTLDNVLPPTSWQSQYKIGNEKIVDAVIFLDDKVLPVDAKFSLENYNRYVEAEPESDKKEAFRKSVSGDLKSRIDETAKYIDEKNGTTPLAFMFIPSEALYYDLVINKVGLGETSRDLVEYAYQERHVIIVSPTTFVAYLQTVLQGIRALTIEKNTEEIRKQIAKLEGHITKYEEYLKKLGKSLGTTVNHYNEASKNFEFIDRDIVKITSSEQHYQRQLLDAPT